MIGGIWIKMIGRIWRTSGQPQPVHDIVVSQMNIPKALPMTAAQRGRLKTLIDKLNFRFGTPTPNLLPTRIPALINAIRTAIIDWFKPANVSIVNPTETTPFASLRDLAIQENRLIYIPGGNSETIYVSGQTGLDLLEISPTTRQNAGITLNDIPEGSCPVVIVPISTGRKPPHGVIIVVKPSVTGFDPIADTRALRHIGHDLAVALQINHLKI